MSVHSLPLAALFVALISLASCNSGNTITQPRDVVFPDSNVSFVRHVQPLLQLGCAFNGCHAETSRIPLDSYVNLFRTPGLIVPGLPQNSMLWQVVAGQLPHTYPLSSLTPNHRTGISVWIREGALNN